MPDNLESTAVDNSDQTATQESTVVKDWREGLDASIKNHPSLQSFKNEGDLAKSWVEAQKLIGKDKIPVPGEKATADDWNQVFDRLGRPKDPNDYQLPEIKRPEGFPEANKEQLESLKQKAHELGLLPAQLQGLYEWYMNDQFGQYGQFAEQRNQQRGEAENALRKMWGKAFEQNYQLAEQAVIKYGNEQFVTKLKASGMNNDPDMIKFIADMAKNFSEDRITGRPVGLTLSPDEAKAEINKIQSEAMKDSKHVMNNKMDPEYDSFLNKWKALHEMAYPDA